MPAFDASKLEDNEYDFTKWGGPKGVIPEPTEHGLTSFYKAVQDISGSTQAEDDLYAKANAMQVDLEARKAGRAKGRAKKPDPAPDPEPTLVSTLELTFHNGALLTAAAGELCQNSPSAEDMTRLPWRVRNLFLGWLIEQYITGTIEDPDPPQPAAGDTTD